MPVVSIVKRAFQLMVEKAVDLLGGISNYVKSGQKVFIKPNVCGGVLGSPAASRTSKFEVDDKHST